VSENKINQKKKLEAVIALGKHMTPSCNPFSRALSPSEKTRAKRVKSKKLAFLPVFLICFPSANPIKTLLQKIGWSKSKQKES
jgi:hypothetical protein